MGQPDYTQINRDAVEAHDSARQSSQEQAAEIAARTVRGGLTQEQYEAKRRRDSLEREIADARTTLEALKSTPGAAYNDERARLTALIAERTAELNQL